MRAENKKERFNMKKVIALILTAVMIASMFSACSADSGLDLPKDADAKTHTKYFKDFLKTDDAVATFINSDSGESDMGWGTEKAYKVLKELEYPEDKLVMHYNEKGSHSSLLWCSVYSEFLTAMVYRRVEPLQQSSDAIR